MAHTHRWIIGMRTPGKPPLETCMDCGATCRHDPRGQLTEYTAPEQARMRPAPRMAS